MASWPTACSSFLKLIPPPPSTRPPSQLIPRGKSDEAPESFVRRQLCAAGAATIVVIGLGGGYNTTFSGANPGKVRDAVPVEPAAVALVKPEQSQKESPRWSDSIQGCPPWWSNSFQVVVPENLPRPSVRRRWESVGNPGSGAPAISASTTSASKSVGRNPGCFSM